MQVDQKERVGLCKNREKVEEYKEIDKFNINHKVIFDYLFKSSYMPV